MWRAPRWSSRRSMRCCEKRGTIVDRLRIDRGLELLGSLKLTVSDFAKKEEQLIRALQSQRIATNRKFNELLRREDDALAAQMAEAEAFFKTEENRIRSRFEARGARVERFS